MAKAQELRQKSREELLDLIRANRKRLLEIRFDLDGKRLKNTKEISMLKKDVARALTLLREEATKSTSKAK